MKIFGLYELSHTHPPVLQRKDGSRDYLVHTDVPFDMVLSHPSSVQQWHCWLFSDAGEERHEKVVRLMKEKGVAEHHLHSMISPVPFPGFQ
jgi:hypothetical protein